MSIKKYTPNILSTIRLAMALVLPSVFATTSLLFSAIYYAIGNATDLVDGYLARKWKVQSKYGKVVDPTADKSLNLMALICTSFYVNPLMFIFVGFESLIASINIARGVNIIKQKKIDMHGMKLTKKIQLLFETVDSMNVSVFGKIKSGVLGVTVFASLLLPVLSSSKASLSVVLASLVGLTSVLEAYVVTKYGLEHYIEKNDEQMATDVPKVAQIDKNKKEQIKKLEYAKKILERFNSLESKIKIPNNSMINNLLDEKTDIMMPVEQDDENKSAKKILKS